MKYLLVVTTHERGGTLADTLASFREHVTPEPLDMVLIEDGNPHDVEAWTGRRVGLGRQAGFCAVVAAGWDEVRESACEYVFWLEHDFLFTRDVDLTCLAHVLDRNRHLAQMSLMRQPLNEAEVARGSVIPDDSLRCSDFLTDYEWMEHGSYWTTNPSLFRTDLARAHAWPRGPECEGRFGVELRDRNYCFGVWDWDVQYVEHVGERTGTGY